MDKKTRDAIADYARATLPDEAQAIPRELIVTSNAGVYPEYDADRPRITGVRVACFVTLSLEEIKPSVRAALEAQASQGQLDTTKGIVRTITSTKDAGTYCGGAKPAPAPAPAAAAQQVLAQMEAARLAMKKRADELEAKLLKGASS